MSYEQALQIPSRPQAFRLMVQSLGLGAAPLKPQRHPQRPIQRGSESARACSQAFRVIMTVSLIQL